MRKTTRKRAGDTTQAEWLTLEGAANYSGLSTRLLTEGIREKLFTSSLVTRDGTKRGRRLINRSSLNAWIEAGIGNATELPQFNREAPKS